MNLIALLIPSFENILHSALFFRGHGGQNIFALSFRNSCGSSGKKFFFFFLFLLWTLLIMHMSVMVVSKHRIGLVEQSSTQKIMCLKTLFNFFTLFSYIYFIFAPVPYFKY